MINTRQIKIRLRKEGPEWDAKAHGTMHSGSGAEETAISGGGE